MNPSTSPFRHLFPLCALLIGAPAFAQTEAKTDPVGFITLDVAGAGAANTTALSFKGLGLTRPVEYQGSAEAVGTNPPNTLTDNEATWTDNQFNGLGAAYYLEVTSGPAAGTTYDIAGTSAATKTITLSQNLGANVAAGVTFKIRKHWTIASVFGAANEAGLTPGTDANSGDQILLYNGTAYERYFFLTGAGWRNVNDPNTDAAQTRLYPDDGVILARRGNTPINVVLMGAVKTGQTSVPTFPGTNVVSNTYAAPMTLASSGLVVLAGGVPDPTKGLAGGNVSTADVVLLWNGTSYDHFYYQTEGIGGVGWRKGGAPTIDASATQIAVGASFVITRKVDTAFDWVSPQHPPNL